MNDIIKPKDGLTIEVGEPLDDENTVGLLEKAEPGGETVTYQDARRAFVTIRKRRGKYDVGDEDSTIFISSDGGDLGVHYGPEFAPIETAIKVWHLETARRQFEGGYPQFELMFDDSGLVVFKQDDTMVGVAPVQFPWDRPAPACGPAGPRGPSVL